MRLDIAPRHRGWPARHLTTTILGSAGGLRALVAKQENKGLVKFSRSSSNILMRRECSATMNIQGAPTALRRESRATRAAYEKTQVDKMSEHLQSTCETYVFRPLTLI